MFLLLTHVQWLDVRSKQTIWHCPRRHRHLRDTMRSCLHHWQALAGQSPINAGQRPSEHATLEGTLCRRDAGGTVQASLEASPTGPEITARAADDAPDEPPRHRARPFRPAAELRNLEQLADHQPGAHEPAKGAGEEGGGAGDDDEYTVSSRILVRFRGAGVFSVFFGIWTTYCFNFFLHFFGRRFGVGNDGMGRQPGKKTTEF